MRTVGSLEFSKRSGTPTDAAKRLGVSISTISLWRSGQRAPARKRRLEIQEKFGVPIAAWDQPPPEREAREALAARPVESLADARAVTLDMISEAIEVCRACLADAADPATDPRERASIVRAAGPELSRLQKMQGMTLELSEAQVLRSPVIAKIAERLAAALKPWPEAAAAAAASLEALSE